MTPETHEEPEPQPPRRDLAGLVGSATDWLRSLPRQVSRIRLRDALGSPWAVGLIAAAWAAGIGLAVAALVMALVWIATPGSGLSVADAMRVAGLLWSVAHGTAVTIGPVTYSLLPWGLAVVPLVLLGYAGGWAARRARVRSVLDLLTLVSMAVFAYSAISFVVAATTSRPDSSVSPLLAALHALILSALAFTWGAWRSSRDALNEAVPAWIVVCLRAGGVGALTILGAGAVGAGAALFVRVDDAITMAQSLAAGVWGGLALLLLGLAYVPVVIVWSSAYLLGAGFTIGPAVAVSPFIPVTAPTQLPPFPLLAAVPQSGTPLAWALPVVGVVAGVLAGLMVVRSAKGSTRLSRLGLAAGAAVVSSATLMLLAVLSDGALGDVRLAHLGPSPTMVGLLTFGLVLVGAVPSAVLPRGPKAPVLVVAHDPAVAEDLEPVVEAPASPSDSMVPGDSMVLGDGQQAQGGMMAADGNARHDTVQITIDEQIVRGP